MKILYVATVVKTHIMEFHIPYLKMFKDMGYETVVAAKNDYENKADCNIPYCDKFYDIDFSRNPFSVKNIKYISLLKKIIEMEECDIVYTHTPVGGAIGRVASYFSDTKPLTMYMAHGFHFYTGANLKGWLFYPVEKFLSYITEVLITINKEDFDRAKNSFHAKKTFMMHGIGVNFDKFEDCKINREEYRKKLNIPKDAFVVLTVGELTNRKNQKTILKAIKEINKKDIIYLLVGQGENREYYNKLVKKFDIKANVRFLGYRNDIPEICKISDVFAFPSKHEGLAIAPLEAMSAGLPIIASDARGIIDYCTFEETGRNYKFDDVDGFADGILWLYNNREKISAIGKNNKNIAKDYRIDNSILEFKEILNVVSKEEENVSIY